MVQGQNDKFQVVLAPISLGGAATATDLEVDTLGYDYAEFLVLSGLVGAAGATLKLQESDATGSGEADITGATITAPVDADDGKLWRISLDLRKRKRFLSMVLVNGANASLFAVVARLTRAEGTPLLAASNLMQSVNI